MLTKSVQQTTVSESVEEDVAMNSPDVVAHQHIVLLLGEEVTQFLQS